MRCCSKCRSQSEAVAQRTVAGDLSGMIMYTVRRFVLTALMLTGGAAVRAQSSVMTPPVVTAADIRFMQGMLQHHRQAIEMTSLVRTRTRAAQLRTLAERIAVSQSDEMAMMRQWLAAHGAAAGTSAPHDTSAHAGHGTPGAAAMVRMPGMLSPAEMRVIRASQGARFDRLFLDGMIRHHVGALVMVETLMATPGAAQESSINRFVTDVDTDQRAEIARMRRMLSSGR